MQVAVSPKSCSETLHRNGKKFSKAQEEVRSKFFYDVNFKLLTGYVSQTYFAPSGLDTSLRHPTRGFAPCYLFRPVGAEENYYAPSGLDTSIRHATRGFTPWV